MEIPSISEIINTITEILKTNQFAQGGFLISFLMALPRYILPWFKKLWLRIERLILYTVNIEETDDLFIYFEMWLSENYEKKYRNVEAALKFSKTDDYNWDKISEKSVKQLDEKVIYKQFSDLFYIRRNLNIIRIFKGREKMENASNLKNAHYNKFIISGLFAKKAITNLVNEVHECAKKKMLKERERVIDVKTSSTYGDWYRENVIEPKKLENIIIKGKEELIEDMEKFINNKKWYRDRDIQYKRGYLFSGAAGTGKTSILMSLARHFKRPIHFLQINGIDDSGLRNAFRNLPPQCMLVIEDIDGAFKKREDGTAKVKFSFSTLLNCLDGVFSSEDVMTIFTTNHPEKLDHALIRSGRIDYKMEFERPSKEYVEKFISLFFKDICDSKLCIDETYNCLLPMVDIQDSCLRFKDDHKMAIEHIMERDLFVKVNGEPEETIYLEPSSENDGDSKREMEIVEPTHY